jgi:transposase
MALRWEPFEEFCPECGSEVEVQTAAPLGQCRNGDKYSCEAGHTGIVIPIPDDDPIETGDGVLIYLVKEDKPTPLPSTDSTIMFECSDVHRRPDGKAIVDRKSKGRKGER